MAIVILLIWAFWLSAEYLVLGEYSYVLLHDFGDSFTPYYLGEGRAGFWAALGGWEPRMLSGLEVAANTISQFRLTNLLIAVMPGWLAIGLVALMQRVIAGLFMYWLVKDTFRGHGLVALGAGMLFAVGLGPIGAESVYGYTHNMGLAPCGLPFLIWAYVRWKDDRPRLLLATMFASGGLLSLATMFFIAMQALICFGLILLFMTPVRQWLRLVPVLLAIGLGYAVVEIPNLVAILSDWPEAHRLFNPAVPAEERISSSVDALVRLFYYQGAAALIVLVAIMLSRRNSLHLPFVVVGPFLVCTALLFLDGVIATLMPGPGTLVNFSFIRIIFVMPFLLILIAAISLSRLTEAIAVRSSGMAGKGLVTALVVSVFLSAFGHDSWAKFNNLRYYSHGANYAVLFNQPALRKVADTQGGDPFRVATVKVDNVTHLLRPSAAWAYGLETVDGYTNVYPRRYQELWIEVIRKSAGQSPSGREGESISRYEYMRAWGNRLFLTVPGSNCSNLRLGDSANIDLLSLMNVRYIISPCPLEDERLKLFAADREGPGQAWHDEGNLEKFLTIFRGEFPSKEIFVYSNPSYLPRYFIAKRFRIFDEADMALKALGEAGLPTLESTVMLARSDMEKIDLPVAGTVGSGTVRVVSVSRNEIRFEVTAEQRALLFIGNSYNSRWTATVQGKARPVFRANHAFQGVMVDAGKSEVVLSYRTALSNFFGID